MAFLTAFVPGRKGTWIGLGICLGLLLAAAYPAYAQTGTITGQVLRADNERPLVGAQVAIPGSGLGTLVGANGRFTLANVPVGTYTLEATLIGYARATEEVTVRAGASVTVNFELRTEALGLDEMVITGEAGQARRREVGNTIARIDADQIREPVANVENLLQGRVVGLSITEAAGSSGSGTMIRLRGNVSVAMSNQPLVYIDGVQIRSDHNPKNVPPVGYDGRSGNVQSSPLADLDPSDIERIEVIKGAAATTLYGTEAAAGVIQIFTKRGTEGAARWTFQTDQGFNRLRAFGPDAPDPLGAPEGLSFYRLDPWLRDGYRQRYSTSVRGGVGDLNYFVSSSWEDNDGILPNDSEERFALRGNFGFSPLDNLTFQWNTSMSLSEVSNTASGNNAHGITLNTYRGNVNYVGGYGEERVQQILNQDIITQFDNFITGVTVRWLPTPEFSHRVNVGYSHIDGELRQLRPFGFVLAPTGIMTNRAWTNQITTLDYAGNYALGLTPDVGATISWGGQVIERVEKMVTGYAEGFPGPGEPTLSSGSLSLSFEDKQRLITGGFFGQARFDWLDRIFLTVGLRIDGNSAFGEDLGLEPYPKASLSYIISDETFWQDGWGEVKLRAAYGQSGRAPGAFDAVRTWNPVRLGDESAFLPLNPGNPELGPERTAEIEFGLDGSWWQGRVNAEFTYYRQTTDDALFAVRLPPSEGAWQSQLENVGKLRNSGIEFGVNATAMDERNYGLDLGVSISTNNSEVLDLGGSPPFTIGAFAWVEEGHPAPVLKGRRVTNPNAIADPIIEEDHYFGPNQPTLIVQPRIEVRVPYGITLSARGEYQGGHYMYEGGTANGVSRSTEWPQCVPIWAALEAGQESRVTAYERSMCDEDNFDFDKYIYPADFFKLRDLTAQIPMDRVVPWGENSVLSLSWRNWFRWTNDRWFAMDPEMGTNTGAASQVREITEHVPPSSRFTASFRVHF